jgi:peptidoglycan lytic transglycosylase G
MRLLRPIIVLVLLACAAGGYAVYRTSEPYQGFSGDVFIDFARGTGTNAMADALARAGVVRSRFDFVLARAINRVGVLQAGE